MDNFIKLPFADGEYVFRLNIRELMELQTKCNAGLGEIVARCMNGYYGPELTDIMEAKFRTEDIYNTVRLGLIGGNSGFVDGKEIPVDPQLALQLTTQYVAGQPLVKGWELACAILLATIQGYEPPKKKAPRKRAAKKLT